MGREKVDIQVDANVANAIAAMMELVKSQGKLGSGAEDVGAKGKAAAKTWGDELEHVVGKWFTIHKAIEVARELLKKFLEEQKKQREEQVGATRAIDTGITGYRIAQGNLSVAAGTDAANRILGVAQNTKSSTEGAFGAATQLARYGVGREQAEGSALTELLKMQDLAQSQDKIDPGSLSRSVLDYLQRTKQPITGDSIRRVGGTAFNLSQKLKGFDSGEIGMSADVAAYGQQAGFGPEQTMAMVGILSETYGEGAAKRRFRTLFKDTKHTSAEQKEISKLRARASGLLAGGDSGYETAVGIAGGSMTDEETLAETRYQASGYKPGILDQATVKKNLIAALRTQRGGPSLLGDAVAGFEFDVASFFLGGPEAAIKNLYNPASGALGRGVQESTRKIREQALGKDEFTVRLLSGDGRDLPVQVEAEALNQDVSNDATQSGNFRP